MKRHIVLMGSALSLLCSATTRATPIYGVTGVTVSQNFIPGSGQGGIQDFTLTGPVLSLSGGTSDEALSGLTYPANVLLPIILTVAANFGFGSGSGGIVNGIAYGGVGNGLAVSGGLIFPLSDFVIEPGAINPTLTGLASVSGTIDACQPDALDCFIKPFDLNILPEVGTLTLTFINDPFAPGLYDEVSAEFTTTPEPTSAPVIAAGLLLLIVASEATQNPIGKRLCGSSSERIQVRKT